MKNIIDLNAEIEKIAQPEIEFHDKFQNIKFYGDWINELPDNYFEVWEARIKDKINNIADLESPSKVKFIKVFQQDVLQKYDDLSKVDYNDLESLKSIPRVVFMTDLSVNPPKSKGRDYFFTGDINDGYEEVLIKMAELYKIESFDYFDGEHDPDSKKDILQDEILNKLNVEDEKLESIYSYVFLSFVLESTRKLLERITKYLDYLVNLINKVENFKEDNLTLEEIQEGDPNKLKLELKLNKLEVSILFKNLNDFGYIEVNNRGQKHPLTQLKKYINNANMYYLNEKGEAELVKNIEKEFSKVYGKTERVMHINREIKFLENLIAKSKDKITQIKSEEF